MQGLRISQIVILGISVSLLATVTNFVPVSLAFVLLMFLIPYLFERIPGNGMVKALWLLYFYFFVSVVIYSPSALLNPSFYRWDGNFFIVFLPLLLFAGIKKQFNAEKIIRGFIVFAAAVNLACMVLPRIGINPEVVMERRGSDPVGIVYIKKEGENLMNHFLFYAHNAAGGFNAIAFSLNVGLLFSKKHRARLLVWICAVVNGLALLDTSSRGSIIGFVASMVVFLLMLKPVLVGNRKKRWDIVVFLFVLVMCFVLSAYLSDRETLNSFLNALNYSNRAGTIVDRIVNLWPRAMEVFRESPIFGIGYGGFNDTPYSFAPLVDSLIAINVPEQFAFNDAHAHNSYLHVLAETGIVGLVLLVYFIIKMRDEIFGIQNRALRVGLFIALGVQLYASFTEHRFFTPAQALPFVLALELVLIGNRAENADEAFPRVWNNTVPLTVKKSG